MTTYVRVVAAKDGVVMVQRVEDNTFIPLSMENRDCKLFIHDWKNGASFTELDGTPIPFNLPDLPALGLEDYTYIPGT